LGFALLQGLKGVLELTQSEYAVTIKWVIIKVEVVKRQSLDMILSKVESIGHKQTTIDPVCGTGTIVVSGSGTTVQDFPNVRRPEEFRREVQQQIVSRETA
jgi:23S rRNA G2445 N2-methylase RlmL